MSGQWEWKEGGPLTCTSVGVLAFLEVLEGSTSWRKTPDISGPDWRRWASSFTAMITRLWFPYCSTCQGKWCEYRIFFFKYCKNIKWILAFTLLAALNKNRGQNMRRQHGRGWKKETRRNVKVIWEIMQSVLAFYWDESFLKNVCLSETCHSCQCINVIGLCFVLFFLSHWSERLQEKCLNGKLVL